jgi:hypothetical protein
VSKFAEMDVIGTKEPALKEVVQAGKHVCGAAKDHNASAAPGKGRVPEVRFKCSGVEALVAVDVNAVVVREFYPRHLLGDLIKGIVATGAQLMHQLLHHGGARLGRSCYDHVARTQRKREAVEPSRFGLQPRELPLHLLHCRRPPAQALPGHFAREGATRAASVTLPL